MGEAPVCGTGEESKWKPNKEDGSAGGVGLFQSRAEVLGSSGLSRGRGTSILVLEPREGARVIGLCLMRENTFRTEGNRRGAVGREGRTGRKKK